MSTVLPMPEQSAQGTSPAAPRPSSQASKPSRVLACVICQQRKLRCDRKFPCANCIKSRAHCVPATLAPCRQRRRVPERELLDRLRRYEDLLRQNNIKFEPLHKDPAAEKESPKLKGGCDSEYEQPEVMRADSSSPSTTVNSERANKAKYALSRTLSQDD